MDKVLKAEQFIDEIGIFKSILIIQKDIQKHIIGKGGIFIKEIQTKSETKIVLENDIVTISSDSLSKNVTALDLISKQLQKFSWFSENGKFVFKNKGGDSFDNEMKKVKEMELKKEEIFDKSKKEFDKGNKAEGMRLLNEGKQLQEEIKLEKLTASKRIFEKVNDSKDMLVIDLHGLYVEHAILFLIERYNKVKSLKGEVFMIIYGAGKHSIGNVCKIKPSVEKYLKENNIAFVGVNDGEIKVNL